MIATRRRLFACNDSIAVYACGILVDLRTVVECSPRKVIDDAGGQWGQGGERWGFRDGAIDGDYIRLAQPGDQDGLLCESGRSVRRLSVMRSALARAPWSRPTRGQVEPPSGATVFRIWQILEQDPAFVAWLKTNR